MDLIGPAVVAAVISGVFAIYQMNWNRKFEQRLEAQKHQHALETHDFQTRLTLLHQKRGDFVGELYDLSESAVYHIMEAFQLDPNDDAQIQTFATEYHSKREQLLKLFTAKRVFLTATTCKALDELLDGSNAVYNHFSSYLAAQRKGDAHQPSATQYWNDAHGYSKSLPATLKRVEEELRSYMEVDWPPSSTRPALDEPQPPALSA